MPPGTYFALYVISIPMSKGWTAIWTWDLFLWVLGVSPFCDLVVLAAALSIAGMLTYAKEWRSPHAIVWAREWLTPIGTSEDADVYDLDDYRDTAA